ncbi:MAG: PEGA domain-containing protein [Fibromonadaceae bacterium]|jgi:hypothetical protein|nr:PEGA domain-containing protein [Fibromonadaceae bacterium]
MSISKSSFILLILLFAAEVFSQEPVPQEEPPAKEDIKLEIPAAPVPVAQKPDTVQKFGAASGLPLNLQALSAKDTASFETYSRRYALIQDSISAAYRAIETAKKNAVSFMQPLEPKSEFEKQADYDARKSKWDSELKQLQERDTKSYSLRLAELEKAKNKVQENQNSLYGSINIKSNPPAVSVLIGKDEIGITPAEYNLLIPGIVKIRLQKEGYNPLDTSLHVAPGAKLMLNAILEEKSIFSPENEVDFVKILSKDTTPQGYESRIEAIYARKTEIDEEIKQILGNFSNTYPPLEPQKSGESPEDFEKRKAAWTNEGTRQFTELQRKHEVYSNKLWRSVETLRDYIVALHSSLVSETVITAKIELGTYDAESEKFKVVAQDTANERTPFYFSGEVGIPLNTAKTLNRTAPGFVTALQYINYPFEADFANVNLAMSKLQLSMNGQDLQVYGSFGELAKYKSMEGYDAWKLHADSLLKGTLKPQGLDYAYAMGKAAAKDVTAENVAKGKESGGGLGWRGWTRILTYTLAAGCVGAGVVKHLKARKYEDKLGDLKDNFPEDEALYANWRKSYNSDADVVNNNISQRNLYGAGAGVLFLAGTLTFIF